MEIDIIGSTFQNLFSGSWEIFSPGHTIIFRPLVIQQVFLSSPTFSHAIEEINGNSINFTCFWPSIFPMVILMKFSFLLFTHSLNCLTFGFMEGGRVLDRNSVESRKGIFTIFVCFIVWLLGWKFLFLLEVELMEKRRRKRDGNCMSLGIYFRTRNFGVASCQKGKFSLNNFFLGKILRKFQKLIKIKFKY